MNIYEKMLGITSEMKTVAKNLEVGLGKTSYKAAGEADVLHAVKTLEEKYKIFSYPAAREIVYSDILTTHKEYNGTVTDANQLFMRIAVTYRFVDIESPADYIEITSYGDGIDTQDKAPGKAMTYADKYALMKAYKIITGDDPDQEHSPDTARITPKKSDAKATPKQIEILSGIYTDDKLTKLLQMNKIERIEDLPLSKASDLIKKLNAKSKNGAK